MSEICGVVVCARVQSSRIPRKVLQEVGDRMAIERLIDNLKKLKYPDSRKPQFPVVLAIPTDSENDPLEKIAKVQGIECYRGENGSPLHRMASVVKSRGWENVVRITADDILIDPWLTRSMLKHHLNHESDYTYCWNVPEGTVGEIIRAGKLLKLAEDMGGQDVEFISYYLRLGDMKVECFNPPMEYRHTYRLTMDYPEDLTVLRILCNSIVQPMGTLDVVNFMRQQRNWYIRKINRLPMVTVYTCAHNHGQYVKQCFESVVSQGAGDWDWEYIVVDDCSSDDTPRILLDLHSTLPVEMQRRVRILRNPQNEGLSVSCNRALSLSRGRYIMRVDSDDFLMPGALVDMVDMMRSAGDVAGLFTGYYEADETGKVVREVPHNEKCHPGCSLLSRREANEIKFKENLTHFEGHEFMQRFAERYKIAHLDKPLWVYRQHLASKSRQRGERDRVAKELGIPGLTSTSAGVA